MPTPPALVGGSKSTPSAPAGGIEPALLKRSSLRVASLAAGSGTPQHLLVAPIRMRAHRQRGASVLLDCGGGGDCGPNSTAASLTALGFSNVSGPSLRAAVGAAVRCPSYLARVAALPTSESQGPPLLVSDLVMASLLTWPEGSLRGLPRSVASWAQLIEQPGTWADLAFLALVADLYAVSVAVHVLDGQGRDVDTYTFPPFERAASAQITLTLWLDHHYVAEFRDAELGELSKPAALTRLPLRSLANSHALARHARAGENMDEQEAREFQFACLASFQLELERVRRAEGIAAPFGGNPDIAVTSNQRDGPATSKRGPADAMEVDWPTAACLREFWREALAVGYTLPVVEFYSPSDGLYRCFSNFFVHVPFQFVLPDCCGSAAVAARGLPVVSPVAFAEQAVMLCKAAAMADYSTYAKLLLVSTPEAAKALGRSVSEWHQDLWDHVVCAVALSVVSQKFRSLPALGAVLAATGGRIIAEMAANDLLWGTGHAAGHAERRGPESWDGLNLLGWALMTVRESLAAAWPEAVARTETSRKAGGKESVQLRNRVPLFALKPAQPSTRRPPLAPPNAPASQPPTWAATIATSARASTLSNGNLNHAAASELLAALKSEGLTTAGPTEPEHENRDEEACDLEAELEYLGGGGEARCLVCAVDLSPHLTDDETPLCYACSLPRAPSAGSRLFNGGASAVEISTPAAADPADPPTVDLRYATELVSALILVCIIGQPLVYAHVNGFTLLGVATPTRYARPICMAAIQAIAHAFTAVFTLAFMVGEYSKSRLRLFVAPVERQAVPEVVCRTPARRSALLASGATFVWCTLGALNGTPSADAAGRALLSVASFVRPTTQLVDAATVTPGEAVEFGFGAARARNLVLRPSLAGEVGPSVSRALAASLRADAALREALIEAALDPLLDGWLDRIQPLDTEAIPPGLLANLPDFADARLDSVRLSPVVRPITTPWYPLPPRQAAAPKEAPPCPRSAGDLLLPETATRVHRWLSDSLRDLSGIRDQLAMGILPDAVSRTRPRPLAIGQTELHVWARGRVWDCRGVCCVVQDFRAPFETHLNLEFLRQRLASTPAWPGYPDQTLVANLLEGVRLDADVELQTVLIPHLVSLPKGFASVEKELRRLHKLGWYSFFATFPFFPMYLNGQGATARKLEDRWRRTTEGGGPRQPTFDASGLRALSINEASHSYHMPRHFANDQRAEMLVWLRSRGLPRPPDAASPESIPRRTKWPKELKPTLHEVMVSLAVLRRAAEVLGEPLYIFGDDAKDYFNQLAMATSELHKLGIVFLAHEGDIDEALAAELAAPGASGARLVFVSEHRLGFGTHGASNLAQRFSNALLDLFRQEMDAAEADAFESASPESLWRAWLHTRAPVQAEGDEPCHAIQWLPPPAEHSATRTVCPQLRLYGAWMYTDDPVWGVVGVARTLRALRIWRRLTDELNLTMAIAEKRTLGSWGKWLGVILIATLGLVTVPREKLLRAGEAIRLTLSSRADFGLYRSLCGLLEHLRAVNLRGRNVMHGLYAPHGPGGASDSGPGTPVVPDPLMVKQLHRWLRLLEHSGGTSFKRAVSRDELEPPPGLYYQACSDAMYECDRSGHLTSENDAGVGGFFHGDYWVFEIPKADIPVLSIPILEFLGPCGNLLVFAASMQAAAHGTNRVVLRTDALTAALTLPAESQRSSLLVAAYQWLRARPEFNAVADHVLIAHMFGDANPVSDAISRRKWQEFACLCAQMGIRPRRLPLPPAFYELYELVRDLAILNSLRGGGDAAGSSSGDAASMDDGAADRHPYKDWGLDEGEALELLIMNMGFLVRAMRRNFNANILHEDLIQGIYDYGYGHHYIGAMIRNAASDFAGLKRCHGHSLVNYGVELIDSAHKHLEHLEAHLEEAREVAEQMNEHILVEYSGGNFAFPLATAGAWKEVERIAAAALAQSRGYRAAAAVPLSVPAAEESGRREAREEWSLVSNIGHNLEVVRRTFARYAPHRHGDDWVDSYDSVRLVLVEAGELHHTWCATSRDDRPARDEACGTLGFLLGSLALALRTVLEDIDSGALAHWVNDVPLNTSVWGAAEQQTFVAQADVRAYQALIVARGAPLIPLAATGRGRRASACEEADAVDSANPGGSVITPVPSDVAVIHARAPVTDTKIARLARQRAASDAADLHAVACVAGHFMRERAAARSDLDTAGARTDVGVAQPAAILRGSVNSWSRVFYPPSEGDGSPVYSPSRSPSPVPQGKCDCGGVNFYRSHLSEAGPLARDPLPFQLTAYNGNNPTDAEDEEYATNGFVQHWWAPLPAAPVATQPGAGSSSDMASLSALLDAGCPSDTDAEMADIDDTKSVDTDASIRRDPINARLGRVALLELREHYVHRSRYGDSESLPDPYHPSWNSIVTTEELAIRLAPRHAELDSAPPCYSPGETQRNSRRLSPMAMARSRTPYVFLSFFIQTDQSVCFRCNRRTPLADRVHTSLMVLGREALHLLHLGWRAATLSPLTYYPNNPDDRGTTSPIPVEDGSEDELMPPPSPPASPPALERDVNAPPSPSPTFESGLYELVGRLADLNGMRGGGDAPSSLLERLREIGSPRSAAPAFCPATNLASPPRISQPPSLAERLVASPPTPLGVQVAPHTRTPTSPHAARQMRAVGTMALPPVLPATTRVASAMAEAGRRYARARAAALTEGGGDMALRAHISALVSTADILEEVGDYGVNANTARIDERAWLLWEEICTNQGTSPLRTAEDARMRPERNAHLLAVLMLHAFAIGVPKTQGAQFIKPRSALAYPLAIVRVFARWGVIMPSYKLLKSALGGLMRLYIAYHGPYSLAPQRAEPFLFSMVRTIVALAEGTVLTAPGRSPRTWTMADHDIFTFAALICFLMVTGFRLGEIVRHLSGEIMYLTRESLTWRIDSMVVADPTDAQLDSMVHGRDRAEVAPSRSKPDQWGETHCPFAAPLVLGPEADNAALWLRDLEKRTPCHGAARRTTPLFADQHGQPYTHAVLDSLLKLVLTHVYGAAAASLFTWHSFRVGLATALHAAGVPDAMIQLVCRWMCPESLHIYRRIGTSEHSANLTAASKAKVDVLQAANAPRVTADQGFQSLLKELDSLSLHAQRAFDATATIAPTVPLAPTPMVQGKRPAPPVTLSPLVRAPQPRDLLVIPRDVYPAYPCAELGGLGWVARVHSATSVTALLDYVSALHKNGAKFERVRLPWTVLRIQEDRTAALARPRT